MAPIKFEDITLAFLRSCLTENGLSGETLTGFDLSDVPEPGQTAAMAFINLYSEKADVDLPTRLVAKQKTDHSDAFEYVEKLGATKREVDFYNQIGSACQMTVPKAFYGRYEQTTGDFLLIMEDRSGPQAGDWVTANLSQAQGLISNLVTMHSRWWESSQIKNADWSAGFSSEPGCFMHVMQQTFQDCATSFIDVFKDEIDDAYAELVLVAYNKPQAIRAFDNARSCLIHGDYHYKNAFFPEEALPIVFDWQCAGYGSPTIDLARVFIFLKGDGVDQQTDSMLAEYHTALTEAGVEHYSVSALQHDMALGYLYNTWLSVNALMETDINIIRDVIAAQGSDLQTVLFEMSARTRHSGCKEFIETY